MACKSRSIVLLFAIMLPHACTSPSVPVSADSAAAPASDIYFSLRGAIESVVLVMTHCKEKKIPVRKISGKKNA